MKFEEFEASFVTENRKLKILIVLSIFIFAAGTLIVYGQRRFYLYQGKAIFEERPLAEEVCRISFMSLVEGIANENVVSHEIIKLVKAEPFKLAVDRILYLKSIEVNKCKLLLQSKGKLMGFVITLDASDRNPFYYKLYQLDEVATSKADL